MVVHDPDNLPLDGYAPHPGDHWRVVLAHGHHVDDATDESHRSSRISAADIAALECDFVALGHWHRFFDASTGNVPAFYSGSPSESVATTVVTAVWLSAKFTAAVEPPPFEFMVGAQFGME